MEIITTKEENNSEVLLKAGDKEIGRLVMTKDDDVYRVTYYPINSNCREQKLNSGRVLLYETLLIEEPCEMSDCIYEHPHSYKLHEE